MNNNDINNFKKGIIENNFDTYCPNCINIFTLIEINSFNNNENMNCKSFQSIRDLIMTIISKLRSFGIKICNEEIKEGKRIDLLHFTLDDNIICDISLNNIDDLLNKIHHKDILKRKIDNERIYR